jgi:hypothetical protein
MAFNFAKALDPEMEQLFRDFYQSLSEKDRPKAFCSSRVLLPLGLGAVLAFDHIGTGFGGIHENLPRRCKLRW